jgi:hypothetical protein
MLQAERITRCEARRMPVGTVLRRIERREQMACLWAHPIEMSRAELPTPARKPVRFESISNSLGVLPVSDSTYAMGPDRSA